MAQKLLTAVLDIRQLQFSLDDDTVDRLNRQYTAAALVLMAIVVSARQHFGEAIHCWCPEQCASNHEVYANIFCWVDDTYYVPFYEKMPQDEEGRERKITYYQWVPIILIFQAFMFIVPYAIWKVLNSRSGINIGVIIEAAIESQNSACSETREKNLQYAIHLLDRYLLVHRPYRTGCAARIMQVLARVCILVYGQLYGNYLTFCYLLIKILYTANAVGQLFLLDIFLGYDFHVLGIHVVRHLLMGDEWKASDRFPRVSMCDFRIRQNTNVHRYTVQCVLPINLFNEKIFTVIWFWLVIVCVVTSIGLLRWFVRLVSWPLQFRFVKRKLNAFDEINQPELPVDVASVKRFVESYLRRDGVFVLRLITKNAGDLVATEILSALWINFGPKERMLQSVARERKCKASNKNSSHQPHQTAVSTFAGVELI